MAVWTQWDPLTGRLSPQMLFPEHKVSNGFWAALKTIKNAQKPLKKLPILARNGLSVFSKVFEFQSYLNFSQSREQSSVFLT